jgi:hypothetical protein
MDHAQPRAVRVTVHRDGSCGDGDTCPAFTTIDTDPGGGYVIGELVVDPDIVAAHAHKMGPGEVLSRVSRSLAPEVFGP